MNTDEFIGRAKSTKFGNKCDFSSVVYVNSKTKVKLTCLTCEHTWMVFPSNFLKGTGCPRCANVMLSNTEDFISKSVAEYGDRYAYNEVLYKDSKTKVTIRCNVCTQTWEQTPSNHLSGKGCPVCAHNMKLSVEELIKQAYAVHGDKFSYISTTLEAKRLVGITCQICQHVFSQGVRAHIVLKCGCPRCSKREPYTKSRFIERSIDAHGSIFGYDRVPVVFSSKVHVQIKCLACKRYLQVTPSNHLINKSGCPFCHKRSSGEELAWLDRLGVPNEARQVRVPKTRYIADAFWNNTVYEFNGSFWHGDPRIFDHIDINKRCGQTYGELYSRTLQKKNKLTSLGYLVKTVWQLDYRNGFLISEKDPHEVSCDE